MGSLSNSIILSFLCSNISSTEAPGIESSGSKENSHHAQIKVSSMISRHEHFSVKHFLSAGGVHCNTGQRGVAMHKEDCIVVLVKPVVEVMAATAPNPPRLCNRHLWGHRGENWQRWRTRVLRRLPGEMKSSCTPICAWTIYPEFAEKPTSSASGAMLWPEKKWL